MPSGPGEWKAVSSRTVYENAWMRVREDWVRRPDGSDSVFGVVEKPDFALVIPMEERAVWLVEQYRHPVGGRYWEFPQGSWEGADPDPEALARAELAEETGLRARELRWLGHLYEAYGYSDQGFHVFLATGLEPGDPARSPEEQDMRVRRVEVTEFERMVRAGEVKDAPSLAAYGLLLLDMDAGGSPRDEPGGAAA